jgi:hypothetical protein
LENLFSHEKVNCGRQLELDIARGLAIAFMVLVHVFELFVETPFPETVSTHVISFLGSPPAAPVFMLLLGAGIVYSKRSSPTFLFKRGIIILILAYTLGLCRDVIPSFIGYLIHGDLEIFQEGVTDFFGVDILQFAGLTFLFFAIVLKLRFKIWQIVLCMFVFGALQAILGEMSTGIFWVDVLTGLFWGSWENSWFPFFSWIFFPAAGYIFGTILMHCKNKTLMYQRLFIISATALIPLVILSYYYNIEFGAFGEFYQQQYYHQDLFGNIIITIFCLLWISLLYFITVLFKNYSFSVLRRWSKNVNQIYITHWIILGSLYYIFIEGPLSLWVIILMSIVVLMVSDLIVWLYLKQKANFLSNK